MILARPLVPWDSAHHYGEGSSPLNTKSNWALSAPAASLLVDRVVIPSGVTGVAIRSRLPCSTGGAAFSVSLTGSKQPVRAASEGEKLSIFKVT